MVEVRCLPFGYPSTGGGYSIPVSCSKRELEWGPLSRFAPDPNPAPVYIDDPLHNGKTDPGIFHAEVYFDVPPQVCDRDAIADRIEDGAGFPGCIAGCHVRLAQAGQRYSQEPGNRANLVTQQIPSVMNMTGTKNLLTIQSPRKIKNQPATIKTSTASMTRLGM